MRLSFHVTILSFGLAIAACNASPSAPSPAASADTAAPTRIGTSAPQPEGPISVPDDMDVAAVQKQLKCATDARGGSCGVLTKLKTCTPWNPAVPSGDGRWIGRGTAVENGKPRETFVLVRSRRVPTVEVAPGQLGVKIGIAEIPKGDPAYSQADRAIRAFERADVPARNNPAMEYVKALTQWPESYAMKTKSGQIDALAGDGAFLCQGPKQELLLAQRTNKSGDGLYAELWAATW